MASHAIIITSICLAGAMANNAQPIKLNGKLELSLPDGSTVRLQPGPYGKGLSVTPVTSRTGTGPRGGAGLGRPPRPGTVELRAMLSKDAAAGHLHPAAHYIEWLSGKEPKAKRASLQQTVYREMRSILAENPKAAPKKTGQGRKSASSGRRGRAAHPATLALREKLEKDRQAGGLKDAAHYIRWLVERANIGLKKARPIVYRELRAAP
jgi:hypothetical protein